MGRTSDARQRLLESGVELMHERGYTAVGVGELCARAGVNKGSFYYFFPSKQDLALGVIDRIAATTRDPLVEMADGSDPPLQRFQDFFRTIYLRQKEMRDQAGKMLGCPLGNLALEMSTRDPKLRRKLEEVFGQYLRSFQKVLDQAVQRGELPPQDTGRAARSVMALLEGAILMAKTADDPEFLNGLEHEALRLVGCSGRE